ncbi:MAG: helix-turn-helix domain-containing protein [Desulfovibrio sp.]|nr:helix-turn-helix domain-containing protein [Desulfovibrio sp.]
MINRPAVKVNTGFDDPFRGSSGDGSPAMALRGLRGKEDITQVELAARLGVSQNAISEMESGKRPISRKMAKRLGEEFDLPYKVFL